MFIEYGELSTKLYELKHPVGTSFDGDLDYYYLQLKNVKGKLLEKIGFSKISNEVGYGKDPKASLITFFAKKQT